MQITDPVADMLTRIRNANSAKHDTVDVPASNLKKDIAKILLDEGYIKAFPSPACVSMPALRSFRRFFAASESPSFPHPRAS